MTAVQKWYVHSARVKLGSNAAFHIRAFKIAYAHSQTKIWIYLAKQYGRVLATQRPPFFRRSRYAVIPIPITNSQDRSLVRSPGPLLKCLVQFLLYLNIDCLVYEPPRMIWRRVVFMTCFTQTRASTKFHSFNSEDVIYTGNCTMWKIAWHLKNISIQYSGKLSDFDPFTK